MRLVVATFAGELPRLEPHLLPPPNAQIASNVDLARSNYQPFRAPVSVATLDKVGTIKTIYRFGQTLDSDSQYWFHWLNDTDVARGHIAGDTLERTFYTEAGQPPRWTDASLATGGGFYPTAYRDLGVPRPSSAALLTTS